MEETAINTKSGRKSQLTNKRLAFIGLIILVQLALIAAVFSLAYTIGKDVGNKEATLSQGLEGFNTLLGSVSNPNRSVSGKVASITKDSVVVENQRGEKKTVKITDQTQISLKAESVKVNEIKSGNTVSVFFESAGQPEPVAEKIIISRQ